MFGQKVNCSVCQKSIRRKKSFILKDGYLCQECQSLLSPQLTLSPKMSVGFISKHLDERALSREREKEFVVTREIGEGASTCLMDEKHRLFLIDDPKRWRMSHPDIYSFDQIMNVQMDIKEVEDGYDFEVYIQLKQSTRRELMFSLSTIKPTERYDDLYLQLNQKGEILVDILMGEEIDHSLWICPKCGTQNNHRFCSHCGRPKSSY